MMMIGMTIRSAYINEITPPKLMPCDHSRLASGMFPTEQTKEIMAMIGPTSAFSINRTTGGPVCRNNPSHQLCGTSVAKNPAIKKPPRISFHSIDQSLTKECATRVHFPSSCSPTDELAAASSSLCSTAKADPGDGGCSWWQCPFPCV